MLTKLQKWGNSQGVRLSKDLLSQAHLSVGDELNVSVQEGKIIIEPVAQVRGRYDLKTLVSQMPQDYQVQEIDWGKPVGKEVW